ncbi:MAG: hypothetical protein ABJB12_18070 [Pseudomonadota bacterium]
MMVRRRLIGSLFGMALACGRVPPLALAPPSTPLARASGIAAPAPPPAPPSAVAGVPSAACEGADIDLRAAFASSACYVLASSLGTAKARLPPGVEEQLDSEPTRLKNHETAAATFSVHNSGLSSATLYFQPVTLRGGTYVSATVVLVEAMARARHLVGGALIPSPFGPDHVARVVVAPGGQARISIPWCAVRTEGHPVRMAPPDWVPLEPGAYLLTAQVDMPIRSRGDREPTPTLAIQILPGEANSHCNNLPE